MDKQKSVNTSSSSAHKITKNLKKLADKDDDWYSSSQSDDSFSQEDTETAPIDITKYLPPANPLIPKIFQEDYEVRTAINIQFNSLPNFNKNKNFQFIEPSERLLQLQEYIAQQSVLRSSKPSSPSENTKNAAESSISKHLTTKEGMNCTQKQESEAIQIAPSQNNTSDQVQTNNTEGTQQGITNTTILANKNLIINTNTETSVFNIPTNQLQQERSINNQKDSQTNLKANDQIKQIIPSQQLVNPQCQVQQQQNQQVFNNQQVQQIGQQQPQNSTLQNQNSMLTVKLKTLVEYHKQNRDNLIYQKYSDYNLNDPTRIGDVIYFATYIANLKNLIKSRKQKDLDSDFNQNKASFNRKVSIKEIKNYHHNFHTSNPSANSQTILNTNSSEQQKIQFSSSFESGNLFCAYKVNETEFDLILQNDINTKGNTQWFFFSVTNAKAGQVLKFNILNLNKPGSLFNEGLCPVIFSVKQNELSGQEWVRGGFNIKYYRGDIQRDGNKGKPYYTLSFSYYIHHSQDTIYFAHSFPYTFTDLKEYINEFMKDETKNKKVSVKKLCKTLAGNNCEMLTITSSSMVKRFQRKGIVIFARQHPGETGGSYMVQGCIDFLLGDSPEAEYLRDNCVFKIVPMLNPDGVIHGNYRCSLAGCDLNRRWKKPRKKLHPTVFHMKEMIKTFGRERELELIIDLHGHSRKMNTFFYGCSYKEDPVLTRIFPYMMSKMTDYISFEECRFNVQKSKEKTARITLWKEQRVMNVFTVEASFYGKQKNQIKSHYSIQDYLDIGKNLVVNLYNYLWEEETEDNKNNSKINNQLIKNNILKEIKDNEQKIINMEPKSDSDGSDSDPSEDELSDEQMIKLLPKSVLTKKQKKLLEQEEEKAKEKREKELAAKRLQKKNELLQGNQSDSQTDRKKFLISKVIPRVSKVVEKKPENVKPEGQVEMVDAAVQTDASFIMEMKAYLMKKQSLQNGLQNGQSINSLLKSQSMGGCMINKLQQKVQDQTNRQFVPNLMSNPLARKENQFFVQQQNQYQRNSLLQNMSPQSQMSALFFDKTNGNQTLRHQNESKFSQGNYKVKEINSSKQEGSLKEKSNAQSQIIKSDNAEQSKLNNGQQNGVNTIQPYQNNSQLSGQKEQILVAQKPKTPQLVSKNQMAEGGGIIPSNSNNSLENCNGDQKTFEQNIEIEKKIQQIVEEIEDVFIHQSLWIQGKEFLYSIQDINIRQDSRILNLEARLLVQEDPVESERLMQSIFLKNPLYFKNTFEYLTFLVDSYQAKSNLVMKKLQNLFLTFQEESVNDAYYLACKSLTLKSKKNMNISRQILEEAIQMAKKPYQKADMYAQLGNTFLDLEDFENAIQCYTQGLEIQPKSDECLNNISYCYLEMNEQQKAIQFGELALQNYPNNSSVLGNLAYIYEELNQLDKAENAYLALLQNKSINSVQYSNYAQFLFFFRFEDPQKRIQIIENLTKGFLLDPTRQNPVFQTFYEMLQKTDQFAKIMYSYKPITYYITFIEAVRLVSPHLLLRMIVKIFLTLQYICSSDVDEGYLDYLDKSEDLQEELEIQQNENQLAQIQNPSNRNQRQQEDIKSEHQQLCMKSVSLQNIYQNQNQQVDTNEFKITQPLQPYSDITFKQQITTHQKVQIYKLMHDLIKIKIQENQMVNSLIAYNKFVSQSLHFKNDIQFWDLYFD
ncbi:hypothetical protein ABPG72_019083 [Tetrahymena utriculariae]